MKKRITVNFKLSLIQHLNVTYWPNWEHTLAHFAVPVNPDHPEPRSIELERAGGIRESQEYLEGCHEKQKCALCKATYFKKITILLTAQQRG